MRGPNAISIEGKCRFDSITQRHPDCFRISIRDWAEKELHSVELHSIGGIIYRRHVEIADCNSRLAGTPIVIAFCELPIADWPLLRPDYRLSLLLGS